ncbi:MAG TPA: dihydroxyacetone kinase subunit DhaL [Jiangellaceae bacterium]|nr:dihydroxyacetone kinase subunit DhaL [Jiangellaceae bacterium]
MDQRLCRAWMAQFASLVDAAAERLTALDAAIGDGDHGVNMRRGMQAAMAALADGSSETPGKVLIATGRSLVAKTGGAAGPLYGTGLRRAGKALGDAESVGVAEVGEALAAMLAGIQDLGAAAEGDKTMVDALIPAVATFKAAADDGLAAAAAAAAQAAADAATATIPMRARKGRASYLGERSIGHEDPGAASTALLLRALADVAAA